MTVIDESSPFEFTHDGVQHNAYVRHYDDGDVDIEIESPNDPTAKAYDEAWDVAESLGILNKERRD